MSNETDLDWLARNVHVWPEGKCEVLVLRPRNVDTIIWSYVLSDTGWITKNQWLARRAELQNKPSWADAPEWAEWLAQDDSGEWYWYAAKPTHPGMKSWWHPAGAKNAQCGKGEVLGEWSDTLERRPELDELEQFVSIEGNQEQKMKRDAGWFERGELPPVGVECDIRHSCWNSEKYEKVTVAAITNEYLIVKYATFEQHYMLKDISFRPIRTEREAAIEEMKQACPHHGSWDSVGRIYAEALYDAGYRKDPK